MYGLPRICKFIIAHCRSHERFFRNLKHEQPFYEKFENKEAVKLSIIDYVAFYNEKRAHSKLGYHSTLEYERVF